MNSLEDIPKVVGEVLELVVESVGEGENGGSAAVLALHGDLGAGKTTFTQELARQLGVADTVVSPTFVVMKGYETTHEYFTQLIHIDAYRIEAVDEMRVMHFGEILGQNNTIITIEWAEKIAELLPTHTLHFDFTATEENHLITLRDA